MNNLKDDNLAHRGAALAKARGQLSKFAVTAMLVIGIASGMFLTSAASAGATTTQCGNGRCVIWLFRIDGA